MSIKTTFHVKRSEAITRIKEIALLAKEKDYRGIEQVTFEEEGLQEFVESFIDLSNIEKWTNTMLGHFLDKPFFRESRFNNYLVDEE